MKKLIVLFAFSCANFFLLQAQTLPKEVQNLLKSHQNTLKTRNVAANRSELPLCNPDTIKYYSYTSDLPPYDSTLEGYIIVEPNLGLNQVENTRYRLDPVSNAYYLVSTLTTTYNDQNDVTREEFYFFYQDGTIQSGSKSDFFYDPITHLEIGSIQYTKDLALNIWEEDYKSTTIYNTSNQVEERIASTYANEEWTFNNRQFYNYGANNKTQTVSSYTWNNLWEYVQKDTFLYNAVDSLEEVLSISQPSNDFVNKNTFEYLLNGQITKFYQWNADSMGFIQNGIVNSLFYPNSKIKQVDYFFDYISSSFGGVVDFYYDSSVECFVLLDNYISNDGTIYKRTKDYYIYGNSIATNAPQNALNWSISPNPNNGDFVINAPENAELTVCNAIGQIVTQLKLSQQQNNLNLQKISSGIYFLTLKMGEKFETKKVVIKD
jgi:hypothetical protein